MCPISPIQNKDYKIQATTTKEEVLFFYQYNNKPHHMQSTT